MRPFGLWVARTLLFCAGSLPLTLIPSVQAEEVDLRSLTTPPPAAVKPFHGAGGPVPQFRFFYDVMLRYRPHLPSQGDVSFDSFHQVGFVELIPWDGLLFLTEIRANPRFFELNYQATERIRFRWGKIWIPYDDMSPHSIFGGRVNASFFLQGEQPFLPDVWAELGVGTKIRVINGTSVTTDLDLYVVNGIDSLAAGSDPAQSGATYPDFSDPTIAADNNSNKAVGGRLFTLFGKKVGFGISYYQGRWTSDNESPESLRLTSVDIQFRPNRTTEFRSGLTMGKINMPLPSARTTFDRGGFYFEAGFLYGKDLKWKTLFRGGVAQNDDRVVDASDRQVIGATLLRRFQALELSLHYDRDFRRVPAKITYDYGALRVATAF